MGYREEIIMKDCPYCADPKHYGLKPASLILVTEEWQWGLGHTSYTFPKVVLGHEQIYSLNAQPEFHIPCGPQANSNGPTKSFKPLPR
jgi:hypothetical protein